MGEEQDSAGTTAAASTPEPSSATAPAESKSSAADRDQSAQSVPDRGDVAFDRLAAGEAPERIRTSLADDADPPSKTKPAQGQGAPATAATEKSDKPARTPTPAATADKAGADGETGTYRLEDYAGLDSRSFNALARTKLLPNPDEWRDTPIGVKAKYVASAQRIISERSRAYAAQQANQRAANPATPATNPNESPATDADLADGGEPSAGGQEAADRQTDAAAPPAAARAQQQPAAGTRQPAATPADPALDELLKPVAEFLGDEGTAPIKQAFAQERAAREQLQTDLSQAMSDSQRVIAQLAEQVFSQQERNALETLKADIPDILDAAKREEVLDHAMAIYRAWSDSGRRITYEQAILQAGRSLYANDVNQAAQQKLLTGRARSLKGSPERGTSRTNPQRTKSAEEKGDEAFDRLAKGEEPERIRAQLTA